MADNFNTFKNIGDTVSFDSLYRGIENMGKAIASARAAKAKAEAKKNDELMKMVYQKNMETGKTPLQGIRNYQDFTNFLTTATNNIASDPNTGMNTVNLLFAEYLTKSQLTTRQSEIEKKLTEGPSQGLAVSPVIGEEYNKAYANGGDMQWFTDQNPKKVLFLARQGITVQPDPESAIKDANGKVTGYKWGYVSATPTKAKNLTDELDKVINNDNNFDKTQDIVGNAKGIGGSTKGYQTATKQDVYTIKPGKVAQLADEYSNDVEIQRFYLVNDNLYDNKVDPLYQTYKTMPEYQGYSDQQLLSLAARDAIKNDIMAYDFSKKKNDLMLLSPPAQTKVVVNNNQPQWVVSTKSSKGDKTILMPGGTSKDIDWTAERVKAAKDAVKNAGGMTEFTVSGNGKGAGKKVMVYLDNNGNVQSGYPKVIEQQNSGMQSNFINQKDFNGQSLEFRPGFTQGINGSYYDPITMEKIPQNKILKISNKWRINDYVKIDGQLYVSVNPVVPDNKDINIGEALIPVVAGDYFDDLGSKMFETDSMTSWKGWQNNAATESLND